MNTNPMTFLQLAIKVLEQEKKPLSPEEIWLTATERGYEKSVDSKGKTPVASLSSRLYVDVRDNPKSQLLKVGSRPTRFAIKAYSLGTYQQEPAALAPSQPLQVKKWGFLEKDLHPFLVYFGFNHLRAYLKTVRHTKSKKADFAEWTHPDIVGCYFGFSDWQTEVTELGKAIGSVSVDLLSFELKRELNFGNLREAFFQAVSNSSWANEGYLAAAHISEDEEFRREIGRLSSSFGIGIIGIDVEDPDATSILFSARHRRDVDWETVNKMTALNVDFREFLKRIKNDISTKEVIKEKYDPVMSKEDLLAGFGKNAS